MHVLFSVSFKPWGRAPLLFGGVIFITPCMGRSGVCSALTHYPSEGASHYAEFNVPELPQVTRPNHIRNIPSVQKCWERMRDKRTKSVIKAIVGHGHCS